MKNLQTKILVSLVLSLVVCVNTGKAQDTDEIPIKINTVLLNVPVIVSDRNGRNIAGLQKENFSIFQAGEKQTIEFFADTEAPMNVAILIDTSGSTRNVLGSIKEAAKNFLLTFNSEDKGMVLSFSYEVQTVINLTSDQNKLKSAINNVANPTIAALEKSSKEGTMYDAMYQVVTKDFVEAKGRKAIVILSDGFEAGTKVSFEKMLNSLVASDTVVYPIVFLTPETAFYFPQNVKTITMQQLLSLPPLNSLNKMTISTGGVIYAADGGDFKGAFQSIADDLKKQYVIGFYPTNAEGGKLAAIKIDVDRKDVVVRTKRTIRLKTPDQKDK